MAAAIWLEWRSSNKLHTKAINEHSRVIVGSALGSDVLLTDPVVDSSHAKIYFDDGSFVIRNLSKESSILYNQRWKIGHDQIVAVQPGDSLTFGNLRIRVTASQSPSSHRRSRVIFKVRCPACSRILDHELNDCPWCDASLVGAEALIYHAEEKEKPISKVEQEVDSSG